MIKLKIDFDRSGLNESQMNNFNISSHMILTLVTLSWQKKKRRSCFVSSLLSIYGLEDMYDVKYEWILLLEKIH